MREHLVKRLYEMFVTDMRVKAVWLGGSQGRGDSDEFSDTDFYLAVEDEAFETFFAEVPERVGALEPLLFYTDFAFRRKSPTERVWFLYLEGWPVHWKLDFHVHTVSSALGADPDQRREKIYCEWKILHDPDHLLAPLPPLPQPEGDEFRAHVQDRVDNLAVNFALNCTYVKREDFWRASNFLQGLYERVFYLMAIDGDASLMNDVYPMRFAKACDPQELAVLQGAAFDRDRVSMAVSALTMLELFESVGRRLSEKVGAGFPAEFVEQVRATYREVVG